MKSNKTVLVMICHKYLNFDQCVRAFITKVTSRYTIVIEIDVSRSFFLLFCYSYIRQKQQDVRTGRQKNKRNTHRLSRFSFFCFSTFWQSRVASRPFVSKSVSESENGKLTFRCEDASR